MNLSQVAVNRPVFTIMATLIVVLVGVIALMRLPVDLMPDVTNPTLTINCTYENASPEEVEELITRPIEQALSAVPGVEELTSTSSEGASRVRVSFTWGTDLDAAANDIRDRLDSVTARLPDDADRPTLSKFDLAAFPVVILGASSQLDPVRLRQIIDDQIKYRIERVPGVAALEVWGGLNREIHVNLNVDKIKALGISLDQILQKIEAGNINLPAGSIDRGNYEVTIRTPGQYGSIEELGETVIAVREGAAIRLKEISDVEDAWQRVRQRVRVNGEPGLRLGVRKQSGTNTVEVATAVNEEFDKIRADFPMIRIITIIDTSDYIRRSISNVGSSALWGGLLAVLILLVFLRNFRSTLIIATAIPISIVATFGLMYFYGMTLNVMTLGGLALGVGMLVDNAIVVLENIFRMRDQGQPSRLAAANGTGEVTAAIVSSTITTMVVFLPVVFIRSMSGVMFKQLAIVVSFSLLCSVASAVTLVPMLAGRVLQPVGYEPPGLLRRLYRLSEQLLRSLEQGYAAVLGWSLRHRWIVLTASLALLGGSILLVPLIGSELMPASDESEVRINAEMEAGTRLDLFDERFTRIEQIVRREVPEATSIIASIGGSPWRGGGAHQGEMRIALPPLSRRSRSSEQVADDLRKSLRDMPGLTIRTRAGQGLNVLRMGMSSDDRVEVEIRGHDLKTADALAQQVRDLIAQVPGITDTRISREGGVPEELVLIDRAKAADMKLTVHQIANALQTVLSGTGAGNYREAGDEYRILVKVKEGEKLDLREILDLKLTNADGVSVALSNVVRSQTQTGPMMIERKNQQRVVFVSANYANRDLGAVLRDVGQRLGELPVPRDFEISFGGDYEEQQKAFGELLLSLALALTLVYMVMACQFESLRDPLVVMFSVPLAAIGVIVTLMATHTTFNIQSYIGCIMLGGIVVNNAILLVDCTNLLRRRDGLDLAAAIAEAGRRRLRPILMTASTTILGLVPLALGLGEGGETQSPMARAVIGGLTSSTLITLVVIPVVYSLFEGLRRKKSPSGQ